MLPNFDLFNINKVSGREGGGHGPVAPHGYVLNCW